MEKVKTMKKKELFIRHVFENFMINQNKSKEANKSRMKMHQKKENIRNFHPIYIIHIS